MFLCQGEKNIDIQEIIKRLRFNGGTKSLHDNFKKILSEYDQNEMKKFLMFVTSCQKPPNFLIVPDFYIDVDFNSDINLNNVPYSHTCFKIIHVPCYQTIDIMRQKMKYAIENCITLDNS